MRDIALREKRGPSENSIATGLRDEFDTENADSCPKSGPDAAKQ